MPLLLRRSVFAAVLFSGAALFATGVQGVAGLDSTLQVAAQRTDEDPTQVRYDRWDCPDEPPARPRV